MNAPTQSFRLQQRRKVAEMYQSQGCLRWVYTGMRYWQLRRQMPQEVVLYGLRGEVLTRLKKPVECLVFVVRVMILNRILVI